MKECKKMTTDRGVQKKKTPMTNKKPKTCRHKKTFPESQENEDGSIVNEDERINELLAANEVLAANLSEKERELSRAKADAQSARQNVDELSKEILIPRDGRKTVMLLKIAEMYGREIEKLREEIYKNLAQIESLKKENESLREEECTEEEIAGAEEAITNYLQDAGNRPSAVHDLLKLIKSMRL